MRHLAQGLFKSVQVFFADGAARRHGVPAKAQQHAGVALGHQVQRIAQMKAGDRAARAFEFMLLTRRLAGGKHKAGPVEFVFDARGYDADHPFIEVRVEYTNRRWRLVLGVKQRLGHLHGYITHIAFDNTAIAVDAVQRARQFVGTRRIIGEQAFNAQRHIR